MELRPGLPVLTERLRLRPPGSDDVEDMLRYRGRADVTRFLPSGPMDADLLNARIRDDDARTGLDDEGQFMTLAAERKSDGRVIGDVVLAARLGMRREAVFRQNEMWDGEWADECVYALLESEWPASPAQANWARSSSQSSSAAAGTGRDR